MASQWPPKKNTAFTLYFSLYKNDGTIIANPGTYTKKVSIDGAAVADISASVTEEDTTYGQLSIGLSASEMNGDAIWVYIVDNTSGCIPFTCTLYTAANTQDGIEGKIDTVDTVVDAVKAQTDKLTFTVANKVDSNVYTWNGTAVHAPATAGIPVVHWHSAGTNGGVDAPANIEDLSVTDTTGLVSCPTTQKVDVETIKTRAITCAAGVTVLANVGFAGAPGANNGPPTTNGTKINQTVDLTSGQSIAIADSTSDAVIADAVWNAATATYGTANTYGALVESGNVGGGNIVAASVTGAVGSVTGAVGSVTGNVGGNVTGSVGSVASGGITAASIANAAIDAATFAADVDAEIAAMVWNAATASYGSAGSYGEALEAVGAAADPWLTNLPGAYGAGTAGKIVGDYVNSSLSAIKTVVDTIQADTDLLDDASGGIADIHTDIADLKTQIGVAGAGLSAIPTIATVTNLTNLPAATADWLTATAVKADAVTKIQNGLATPTNITAGTITTVTNLTNAPSNGDFTATMKSSITAAVPTAAGIADAVWDEASTGHTDAGKAGAQVWTDIDAILADTGTDGVAVASGVVVDANIKKINGTTVNGDGGATPWGP